MNKRFSNHKILKTSNCPFNETHYSWFKFGDIYYAEKFAKELFIGFLKENEEWILSASEIVILPSPYQTLYTASNYLCFFFKQMLNQFLFSNNKKACIESKIYRSQTYTEDYGNLSFEQRLKLIANDSYHIDKNFIHGKSCIFLDDIKITGSHEYTINEILSRSQIKGDFIFVYFAELCNLHIDPKIENFYNYFAVKSPQDIIHLLNKPTFRFNTRNVKYILKMEEIDFNEILNNFSIHQKRELFQLSIGNNYHQIKEFQESINILNQKLWQ
jgi:hypothetical protein